MILDGMWSTQYCRDFESFHSLPSSDAVGSALDYFIFFVLDFFPRLSWLLIFFFHLLELELSSAPKENLRRIHFTLQKQKERKWHQVEDEKHPDYQGSLYCYHDEISLVSL